MFRRAKRARKKTKKKQMAYPLFNPHNKHTPSSDIRRQVKYVGGD